MANNTYATVDNFMAYLDYRTIAELSNDVNSHVAESENIQFLLDMQASELDSYLYGRYGTSTPVLSGTIPMVVTKWVLATAARRLFARRTTMPKEVEADAAWADEWIKLLMENKIGIPGISRVSQPTLQDSNFVDGRSEFDWIFGGSPSLTGPSGGQ